MDDPCRLKKSRTSLAPNAIPGRTLMAYSEVKLVNNFPAALARPIIVPDRSIGLNHL
jgi:hypothetical protein